MGMDIKAVLARNLRKLRELRGLSQEALAHDAGINRGYVSDLEQRKSWPTTRKLVQLAKVLKVRPCELIDERADFS